MAALADWLVWRRAIRPWCGLRGMIEAAWKSGAHGESCRIVETLPATSSFNVACRRRQLCMWAERSSKLRLYENLVWIEVQLDGFFRFRAGWGKFPSGDGVFGRLDEDWAAAHGFDRLHLPIRGHDGDHLDGS